MLSREQYETSVFKALGMDYDEGVELDSAMDTIIAKDFSTVSDTVEYIDSLDIPIKNKIVLSITAGRVSG